jgi:hypothetical protein
MVFTLDSESIIAILTFLAPVIGLVIAWLKKKLGDTQGDMTFTVLNGWVTEAQNLAISFPTIKPYVDELADTVKHAQSLWVDPSNNSAELAQVYAHASVLIAKIYELVKKYAPAKPA